MEGVQDLLLTESVRELKCEFSRAPVGSGCTGYYLWERAPESQGALLSISNTLLPKVT